MRREQESISAAWSTAGRRRPSAMPRALPVAPQGTGQCRLGCGPRAAPRRSHCTPPLAPALVMSDMRMPTAIGVAQRPRAHGRAAGDGAGSACLTVAVVDCMHLSLNPMVCERLEKSDPRIDGVNSPLPHSGPEQAMASGSSLEEIHLLFECDTIEHDPLRIGEILDDPGATSAPIIRGKCPWRILVDFVRVGAGLDSPCNSHSLKVPTQTSSDMG
jgi:hypothetical protein